MSVETTVETNYNSDPKLYGYVFKCLGSGSKDAPENGGEAVGIKLAFTTRDADNKIVEDRSVLPLKGCRHFSEGNCEIGEKVCSVAAAVSMSEYRDRINELKKLQVAQARS